MYTPLISVIIPVYNAELYLAECLNSIINQTFKDIEIICVNDGSTDNSAAILDNYAQKDSRITVIHQTNQRQGAARNNGLKVATGQFVSFVDADDFLDVETYEILSSQLYNADLLAFASQGFAVGGEQDCLAFFGRGAKAPFVGKKDLSYEMKSKLSVSVCRKIFRKDIIDAYGISFPTAVLYEDNAFVFKYLSVAKNIYHFEQTFYHRRVHPSSTMTMTFREKNTAIDILYVCDDIHTFLVKHHLLLENEKLFAEKLQNSLKFALRHSRQSKKEQIFQAYSEYVTLFFGDSAYSTLCLEYADKIKNKYVFSLRKYYTYKILSLLTFGKAKQSFCRKCHIQLDFKK